MGLKRREPGSGGGIRSRLNRTSVGLKRQKAAATRLPRASPQSNQRGIETVEAIKTSRCKPRRLNRTSVGLKPESGAPHPERALPPQSNQRGIETESHCRGAHRRAIRLNRTSVGLKHTSGAAPGPGESRLNRTSVGLKPGSLTNPSPTDTTPQSNQRGIETQAPVSRLHHAGQGLNRTSVGLKLALDIVIGTLHAASIEPAWD